MSGTMNVTDFFWERDRVTGWGCCDSTPATLKADPSSNAAEAPDDPASLAAVNVNESLRIFTVCEDSERGDTDFERYLAST